MSSGTFGIGTINRRRAVFTRASTLPLSLPLPGAEAVAEHRNAAARPTTATALWETRAGTVELRLGFSEWNLKSEFGEDARVLRAGYGYRWMGNVLDLNLEATRRDPVNDEAPEHGLMLCGGMRW